MTNIEVKTDFTFTIVPHWVQEVTKPTELAAYVVLGKYANNTTKECWPSITTLSKDLKRSRSATIDALKGLEKNKCIKIQKRKIESGDYDRNLYTLMTHNPGGVENKTTPSKKVNHASKENDTRGSSENSTLTRLNTTRPKELYNKEIQNKYKDEIVEVLGIYKPTQNKWGQIDRAAKQLFNAGVTVGEIRTLAQNIVLTYGESACTVNSLPNHTELLRGARNKPNTAYLEKSNKNKLKEWAND